MARLILSLDNQVLAEYNMTKERYTIGRLPDNDVRIDNPAVSGHHSLIINILNDSFLEDLNSTNGTYLNSSKVRTGTLEDYDVIDLGTCRIRCRLVMPDESERIGEHEAVSEWGSGSNLKPKKKRRGGRRNIRVVK